MGKMMSRIGTAALIISLVCSSIAICLSCYTLYLNWCAVQAADQAELENEELLEHIWTVESP